MSGLLVDLNLEPDPEVGLSRMRLEPNLTLNLVMELILDHIHVLVPVMSVPDPPSLCL